MTSRTDHLGQSYLMGESALAGIREYAEQNLIATNAEINLDAYKHALSISR